MKKNVSLFSIVALTGVLFFGACTKEADKPEEENPTPVVTAKFTWSESSGTFTADYAEFNPDFNNIHASKVDDSSVDIMLEDLNKGTHSIVPTAGRTLVYVNNKNITLDGVSGSVTISENTGTTLSGSYNCKLENGSNISGTFSNIPKK